MGKKGQTAYRKAREKGSSRLEAALSYFEAEPEEKKEAISTQKRNFPGRFKPSGAAPPEWGRKLGLWHRSVRSTILMEEHLYLRTIEEKRPLIETEYADVEALTGEDLAFLHHTHGIDPSMVEFILEVDLPQSLHDAYEEAYRAHRATGADG